MTQPTLIDTAVRLTDATLYGRPAVSGSGTVTSVDVSGGTSGLVFTGGAITTTGTITLSSGILTVPYGGIGVGTLAAGYVKSNGTSAFTSQAIPIPVTDGGTGATNLNAFLLSSRQINTTLPLAGGGDMTADRTLSIAATVANDGGAVVNQAATPGTQQTGNANLSGKIIAGTQLWAGPTGYATTSMIVGRKTTVGQWALVESVQQDAATGAQFVATCDTGQAQLAAVGSGATLAPLGPGQSACALISSVGMTSGILLVANDSSAPLSFYTGGSAVGNLRMTIDSTGFVNVKTTLRVAASSNPNASTIIANGTIEIANGSGGGLRFADGSIQTTAVGGGGTVPSTRLINTTAPLFGGGDLSADRTLTLSVVPGAEGGAVALQAGVGTPQTGSANLNGMITVGAAYTGGIIENTGNTSGIQQILNYNTDASGADHSVCAAFTAQTATASAYFELDNASFTGTGARQPNSAVLYANANATSGLSIAAQASAPIRLYAGGILASNERARLDASGAVGLTINTSGTMLSGLYPLTVSRNTAVARSFSFGSPIAHFIGVDTNIASVLLDAFGSNLYTPNFACRHAAGTNASPSATQNATDIFSLVGFGYGATGYSSAPRAGVYGVSAENWTDSTQGTIIQFALTPVGSVGTQYFAFTSSSLLMGQAASATPTGMYIIGQSSRQFSDTNVGGGSMTLQTGLGTGTGTPAAMIFDVPLGVPSGTNAQSYQHIFRLTGSLQNIPPTALLTGWLQNTQNHKRVVSDATNATTTFSNLSDLSLTVIAGQVLEGEMTLFAKDSTAADGLKLDFNGGTATMTDFEAYAITSASTAPTIGALESTSLAGVINWTSMGITTNVLVTVKIHLAVNAGGTLIPRFAQNAHSTGTATIRAGSWLRLEVAGN